MSRRYCYHLYLQFRSGILLPKSTKQSQEPWHERKLFWGAVGAIGVFCSLVLHVVGTMKHDLRWMLIAAYPFGALALWSALKLLGVRLWLRIAFVLLLGCGLLGLNYWLNPISDNEVPTHAIITGYQIMPYAAEEPPQVRIHIKSALSVGVVTSLYALTAMEIREDVEQRKNFENAAWSDFETRLPNLPRVPLTVPSNQDVIIPLKGTVLLSKDDLDKKPSNKRFYFLSRLFDSSGNIVFDSCIYVRPDDPSIIYFCVEHNY